MEEIEKNFSLEFNYLKETPDFKKIFLSHISSDKEFFLLKEYCASTFHPYAYLIQALLFEHGIQKPNEIGDPDYQQALHYYNIGAEKNEAYCLYRLFFIYKNDFAKFGIGEADPQKQLNYLLKASAYFDEKDNRFSDKVIDPIFHLAVYIDSDTDEHKSFQTMLYEKIQPSDEYVANWLNIKFPKDEQAKTKAIESQRLLAEEKKNPDAAYHLGDNYRWGGEGLEKDSEKALNYLNIASECGLAKACESIAIIHIEDRNYDKARLWLEKGEKLGSYLCIKFLGEYEISGKAIPKNLSSGLRRLKLAFCIGDFWAAWTMVIVYRYLIETKQEKRLKNIYKYSDIIYRSKDIIGNILYVTIRHSSIASCYAKGVIVKKELNKALELHLDCLNEIKKESFKGHTYYKVGRLYEKLGFSKKALDYYRLGFKARTDFIKKEQKREPPHYYNYGKMFEFGRGVPKSEERAIYYYKEGAEYNSVLSFHVVYGNKCSRRLSALQAKIPDPNLKIIQDRVRKNEYVENTVPSVSESKYDVLDLIELFSSSCSIEAIDYKYGAKSPFEKHMNMRFSIKDIHFSLQWRFLKLIMFVDNSMRERVLGLKGIGPVKKENKIVLLFQVPSNKTLISLEMFLLNHKYESLHKNKEFFLNMLEKIVKCILSIIGVFYKNPYLTAQSFLILKGEKPYETEVYFNYKFFYDNLDYLEGEGNQFQIKNAKHHEFAFIQYVSSYYKGETPINEDLLKILLNEIKTYMVNANQSENSQDLFEVLENLFKIKDKKGEDS